jgi:hypothetical protein
MKNPILVNSPGEVCKLLINASLLV